MHGADAGVSWPGGVACRKFIDSEKAKEAAERAKARGSRKMGTGTSRARLWDIGR